jgi:hypothetical protein
MTTALALETERDCTGTLSGDWSAQGHDQIDIDAEVMERWLVTARMHPRRFRELVPAPFLEPRLVDDSLVIGLCAVRMRHTAPAWMPLQRGPASLICAIRIACRQQDGQPCSWVTRRHTSTALALALTAAGFPQVSGGLIEQRAADGGLALSAEDGLLQVRLSPGHAADPELFADADAMQAFVAGCERSITPGRLPGRWAVMGLSHQGGGAFAHCRGWEGWLRTPWSDCTIDGIYRMTGGVCRWSSGGEVDDHGRII